MILVFLTAKAAVATWVGINAKAYSLKGSLYVHSPSLN